jgi:DNA polymerase/3'-5' exonuclease PolX
MHARALRVAEAMAIELAPVCHRIEVVGAIRRSEAFVETIELVAIPRQRKDVFGDPLEGTELDPLLEHLAAENRLLPRNGSEAWGARYKAAVAVRAQMPVDLFLVHDRDAWGGCVAMRTGPAGFRERLITSAKVRGLECRDSVLYQRSTGDVVPTPDERSFIEACGLEWAEPRNRR